jgi:23S rRNA pseudouridine2605 synthase
MMRLQLFLAKAGIASRRAAEKIIQAGRVQVNGLTITALGTKVDEHDAVSCDGRPVVLISRLVYLAVYKPVGVLCTQADEKNRPKVIDLIPEELRPGLFHVGRLDFMSSGLIFYTNDGDFARKVTHPSFEIEKEYLLETIEPLPPDMLEAYRKGIEIEGETYNLLAYRSVGKNKANLVLTQGKNREIRRVCAAFSAQVKRLVRIRIGPVLLGKLQLGGFSALSAREIDWFLGRAKSSFRPPQKQN